MRNKNLSLKECRKLINNLPNSLAIRSDLTRIYTDVKKLIKDSKNINASREYYSPKIKQGLTILRNELKHKKQ